MSKQRATVWTSGKKFWIDVEDKRVSIATLSRIGVEVLAGRTKDNPMDLDVKVKSTQFSRAELRAIKNVRKVIRQRLPQMPSKDDIAVRELVVSVTDIKPAGEVRFLRMFKSADCGGERVPGTRRRHANPIFKLEAQTTLRATFDVGLRRVKFDGRRWKTLDTVDDGQPPRIIDVGNDWGKAVLLGELPVACVDPGDGAIYHRWIEFREPLRFELKSTGSKKKTTRKTSKKKASKKAG